MSKLTITLTKYNMADAASDEVFCDAYAARVRELAKETWPDERVEVDWATSATFNDTIECDCDAVCVCDDALQCLTEDAWADTCSGIDAPEASP